MHTRSRFLSLMFAVTLTASMASYLPGMPAPPETLQAAAADTEEEPDASTNMTIDFNYETNKHVTTPDDSFLRIGEESYEKITYYTPESKKEWQKFYDSHQWQHITCWSSEANDEGSIRTYLTSTDKEIEYLCLTQDYSYSNWGRTPWKPMVVTKDKVLDLNGHKLEIRYDRNVNHSTSNKCQNTIPDTHLATCIEIENGATLTIIDSSAWRGEGPDQKGTGGISFTGYMIDPYKYDIKFHTTRDLFHVNNGNLVIYGGTFQAGRKKDQLKSSFSMSRLKTVIGSAVEMGVNVAEYATGLNTASAAYKDVLKSTLSKAALAENGDTGEDDNKQGDTQTVVERDGKNQNAVPKEADETEGPSGKDDREPTIGEKKDKNKESENKSNDKKNAKDDTNTKLAEAENKIVKQATGKDGIMGIVDSAFSLASGISSLFAPDNKSRVTQCIKGTVVCVGNDGSFVSYGGTYKGYGSTQNTRNGVVEVHVDPSTPKTFDHSKYAGGLAYVYGGTFEAYNGANVFNMVTVSSGRPYALEYSGGNSSNPDSVTLDNKETADVEVLYYENQPDYVSGKADKLIPINTANIQVRGGLFRCYYDLMNVTTRKDEDDEHFRKFPGTMGSVNLGVGSFNTNLIQDGRIQISDKYGAGSLVLLDEQSSEEADGQGLYHYRLFCGDSELRTKSYYSVYPNPKLKTNTSHSMQLSTYEGTGKATSRILEEDEENIRAPYRQTENYFDYMIDDARASRWSVMPNFHYAETDSIQAKMDVYGAGIRESEVWYYPLPHAADGSVIEDVGYGEAAMRTISAYVGYNPYAVGSPTSQLDNFITEAGLMEPSSRNCDDKKFKSLEKNSAVNPLYYTLSYDSIRNEMLYFTYKVYRVDPLSRESISESKTFGVDEPLITVRYGAGLRDALKCKLPLTEVEQQIKNKRQGQGWGGFQQGEMYRIVLTIEQRIGIHYDEDGYAEQLPEAKCESSILFRCFSSSELKDEEEAYKERDFTPVQFDLKQVTDPTSMSGRTMTVPVVEAGQYANVHLVNGKAGMTDYRGDVKVFDLYYQWWEVEEDGTPVKLLAGTDNIYDGPADERSKHNNYEWNVGKDNKTYVNTVDPNDPYLSFYGENGLPKNQNDWTDKMVHLYSQAMTDKRDLTGDHTTNLYLGNNNIFATNTDTCYIPEEMAGKYIQVKVIAQNLDWPMAYDTMQTFYSHPVLVGGTVRTLSGEVSTEYAEGETYAAYDKPVTISLDNVDGLYSSEKITSVWYVAGYSTKKFDDLSITDLSELPTVQYPADFFDADYDLKKISAKDCRAFARIETNKGRVLMTADAHFNYEVEATDIALVGDQTEEYKLSDILKGKYPNGVWKYYALPMGASVGYDFNNYTTTDEKVATLNEAGRIIFGGGFGETEITVTSPNGKTVSMTVRVINDYDSFEVEGIKAPVIGEQLSTNAVVPADAPYHVKDVKWYKDYKSWTNGQEADPDEIADYGHPYRAEVTLESNEFCIADWNSDYSLTVEFPDGSSDTATGTQVDQAYDYDTRKHLQEFTVSYEFPAQTDPNATVINEIHLDFPTKVPEGVYIDEWINDNVSFYANGPTDGFTLSIVPAFSEDCERIARAYNYSSSKDVAVFVKGMQTGLSVHIGVPDDLEAKGNSIAEQVTLIINGEESGHITWSSEDTLWFEALDSLTVTDGTLQLQYPDYKVAGVNAVVGETVTLEDLFTSSNAQLEVTMTGISSSYDVNDFFEYDLDAGTFTPIQAHQTASFYVGYVLTAQTGGSGIPEYRHEGYVTIDGIYENAADAPEITEPAVKQIGITALHPDGSEAYSGEYPYTAYMSVPEVEDALICGIYDDTDTFLKYSKNALEYGAGRIQATLQDGGQYTLKTVPADSMQVCPGTAEVYAFAEAPDGSDVPGISISVDGVHYISSARLTGLTSDTDYTLYYRQGFDGTVYSKTFRTAKQDYGVYLGRTAVTDSNLGSLDRDGWHYDPETHTLTLKDYNLRSFGAVSWVEPFDQWKLNYNSVIVSRQDLNLVLIGENTVETPVSDSSYSAVYAENGVTISGNGNLTLRGCGYGLESRGGDIYLKGTGTLTFENVTTGFYAWKDGKVFYENGTVAYNGIPKTINDSPYLSGQLIRYTDVDRLDFTNKTHSLKITVGDVNGNTMDVSEDELREQIKANYNATIGYEKVHVTIKPIHNDAEKIIAEEYLESGSCEEGANYYFACECGHISDITYTVEAHEHNLVHHEAQAPTCDAAGWEAYDVCEDCGYSTYEELPALGHDLTYHEAKAATCTEPGKAAHYTCGNCGEVFADENGMFKLTEAELEVPALGHNRIQHLAVTPSCKEEGKITYWECTHCGELSADELGLTLLTPEELVVPKNDHSWGAWERTKEPTTTEEGEETRVCAVCGETETRAVETLPVTTTSETTTTSTSETESAETTTSTSATKSTETTTSTSATKSTETTTSTSATKSTETTTSTSATKSTETTTSTSATKSTETTTSTSATKSTETTTSTSATKSTETTTSTSETESAETTTSTSETESTETTATTAEPLTPAEGDYNGDGEVSIADAVMLARIIAEDDALTEEEIGIILAAKPDTDEDGMLTLLDLRTMVKKLEADDSSTD